jgi:hypothetical protein
MRDPSDCIKVTYELNGNFGIFSVPPLVSTLNTGLETKYLLGTGVRSELRVFRDYNSRWRTLKIRTEQEGHRVLRGRTHVQCQLWSYHQGATGRNDLKKLIAPVHGNHPGFGKLYFHSDSDVPWPYLQNDIPLPKTTAEAPSNVDALNSDALNSDIPWQYVPNDIPWPMTTTDSEAPSIEDALTELRLGLPGESNALTELRLGLPGYSNAEVSTEGDPTYQRKTYPGYHPQRPTSTPSAIQGQQWDFGNSEISPSTQYDRYRDQT